ncbi:MAG: hypothetical protein ORN98_05350 [Alphaproteobacteria bacterium]|nr:hypothetical protein [Alphaproteobacteria bacterium]
MSFLSKTLFLAAKLRQGRHARGGVMLFISLFLGVASVAAIGSFAASVMAGMRQEGAAILGGDIKITVNQRHFSEDEKIWLQNQSQEMSFGAATRTMIASQNRTAMVDMTLVDPNHYPLNGRVNYIVSTQVPPDNVRGNSPHPNVEPAPKLSEILAEGGVLLGPSLVQQWGLQLGDHVQLNNLELVFRGIITENSPGGNGRPALGALMLANYAQLASSGLAEAGSLFSSLAWLRLKPNQTIADFRTHAQKEFPHAGWQIIDRDDPNPSLSRFIDWVQKFLSLAGLASLLLGGMSVSHGLVNRIQKREADLALVKLLGATPSLVLGSELVNIARVLLSAIILGLVVGSAVPYLLAVGQQIGHFSIGFPMIAGIYGQKIAMAGLFGIAVSGIAVIKPLARVASLRPALLFRPAASQAPMEQFLGFFRIIRNFNRVSFLSLFGWFVLMGLAIMVIKPWPLGVVFFSLIGIGYLLFRGEAKLLSAICRKIRPKFTTYPALQLALSRLARPNRGYAAVIASFGLSLSLVSMAIFVGVALNHALSSQIPAQAPSHFFLDIGQAQKSEFIALLDESGVTNDPGIGNAVSNPQPKINISPILRGRITEIKGVPVDKVKIPPMIAWSVESDRGLSWSEDLPYGSTLVKGDWWQPKDFGTPLISIEEGLAAGFDLKIGDSMTLTVLGRPITAKIANIRRVNWLSLAINHAILFVPGVLEHAPYTYLATAIIPPESEAKLAAILNRHLPNISVIKIREMLEKMNSNMKSMTSAVRLVAGLLVLVSLLVVGQIILAWVPGRAKDIAISQVLGATPAMLRRSILIEFALIGFLVTLLAFEVGIGCAIFVSQGIMRLPFELPRFDMILGLFSLIALGIGIAVLVSLAVSEVILRKPLAALLRQG